MAEPEPCSSKVNPQSGKTSRKSGWEAARRKMLTGIVKGPSKEKHARGWGILSSSVEEKSGERPVKLGAPGSVAQSKRRLAVPAEDFDSENPSGPGAIAIKLPIRRKVPPPDLPPRLTEHLAASAPQLGGASKKDAWQVAVQRIHALGGLPPPDQPRPLALPRKHAQSLQPVGHTHDIWTASPTAPGSPVVSTPAKRALAGVVVPTAARTGATGAQLQPLNSRLSSSPSNRKQQGQQPLQPASRFTVVQPAPWGQMAKAARMSNLMTSLSSRSPVASLSSPLRNSGL
jgi:hypothetical protein